MKALGIIPARGGSKGIPKKNLVLLKGKPLISHTIESALRSTLDELFVTSDSEEILEVAQKYGSKVIKRPGSLAQDQTPMTETIIHAYHQISQSLKGQFDIIVLLQPTCPLRTSNDIDRAIELLDDPSILSVISVYQVEDHHPARMYRIQNSRLKSLDPSHQDVRRQDLPPVFHRNGLIYAVRVDAFLEKKSFFMEPTAPLLIDPSRCLNIDRPLDLQFARSIFAESKPFLNA